MRRVVGAERAGLTFAPASQAEGRIIAVSGTTASDESGNLMFPGDIVGQTRYIYGKIRAVLEAAGSSLDDVVATREFLTTTEGYRGTADVRREVFGTENFPAATGVVVAGLLRPGALIEIEALAVVPTGGGS
ncbi:MAG: RidA family protein [Nocardioidaceae bacterium]